jgi:DNA-binding NarL/FixJ family response regulator
MDLRMPRCDGIEAIRRLAERGERPRAIALTTYADDASVLGALRAGARGYLTKDAGADEIRAAVEAVARGEAALDPAVQHHLSNAEIAERLVVSAATVKSHVNQLLAKAGARDWAQAVTYAYLHGLNR